MVHVCFSLPRAMGDTPSSQNLGRPSSSSSCSSSSSLSLSKLSCDGKAGTLSSRLVLLRGVNVILGRGVQGDILNSFDTGDSKETAALRLSKMRCCFSRLSRGILTPINGGRLVGVVLISWIAGVEAAFVGWLWKSCLVLSPMSTVSGTTLGEDLAELHVAKGLVEDAEGRDPAGELE
jgi:hypothetical protein